MPPKKRDLSDNDSSAEDEELYNVEKILKHKIDIKTLQAKFFLKWEGYDDSHNSWEPLINMYHCMEQILEFEKRKRGEFRRSAKKFLSEEAVADLGNFAVSISK